MSGNIIQLTKENFRKEVQEGDQTILVDFWAPWCGPCRAVGPELEAVASQVKGGARFAKVNVDEEPELAEKYGVQSIPNLIVFKKGVPVRRLIGFHDRKVILEAVS